MAIVDGISAAAPAPCRTRPAISTSSVPLAATTTAPTAKTRLPVTTVTRWPSMSPSRPPRTTRAATASMYAPTAQLRAAVPTPR
ncbi:hypothetical protein WKI68_04325 [Streptomyces sp. MS1.HAVA.3]|uniref:Uncharacterized protein n=1 Tax=Streptomyces caledonius TaxID=3134107 RepID=A0ABU8TZ38_9ACTN